MLLQSIKATFKKVTYELTIIILGVLIALGANAWYSDYLQQQQANKLLTNLNYELTKNVESLEEVIDSYTRNHQKVEGLEAKLEQGESLESEDITFTFHMLRVRRGAWSFAKNRDEVNTLPIELLIGINMANTYNQNAEVMVSDFIFKNHDEIIKLRADDKLEEYLDVLSRELAQAVFTLKLAHISTKKPLEKINEYQETGQLKADSQEFILQSEM